MGWIAGAFWPVHRSPARWPLGQLVGPPCSCFVPAFNAQVADFAIFMVRILEWAGKDRHSVDGPATGTGIFTAIAGSHAGFGALRGHKGEYAPFGPSRKSFRSLPYSKGPTTNRAAPFDIPRRYPDVCFGWRIQPIDAYHANFGGRGGGLFDHRSDLCLAQAYCERLSAHAALSDTIPCRGRCRSIDRRDSGLADSHIHQ